MQELINKLVGEAGISADQATKALGTMMDFVKSKLPTAMHGTIDAMMGNGTPSATGAESAKEEAGIMDKAGDMADAAKEKLAAFTNPENLEHMKDQAAEKLEDLKDQASDMAKDAFGKLKGLFGSKE